MLWPRVKIRTAGYQPAVGKLGDLDKAMRVERPVHLHWVVVPNDPGEAWFVFVTQAHWVPAFFEDYEGFKSREQKCG